MTQKELDEYSIAIAKAINEKLKERDMKIARFLVPYLLLLFCVYFH